MPDLALITDRIGPAGAIAAATLLGLALAGLVGAFLSRDRDRVARRLTRIAAAQASPRGSAPPVQLTDRLTAALTRFPATPLLSPRQRGSYERRFQRAGLDPGRTLPLIMAVKIGAALAAAAVTAALMLVTGLAQGILGAAGGAIAAALTASLSPEVVLERRARRRQARIEAHLPDALDLLIVCAEAGQTLDAAMARVGREIAFVDAGLGAELGRTAADLRILPDRTQALHGLAERNDAPGLRGVVATLVQGQRQGTPLSQSLRSVGREIRDRRLARIQEKAARLPALITIPLVLLILPAFFVVMVGPAIIQVTDILGGF